MYALFTETALLCCTVAFIFFIVVLGGSTLWHLQKILRYSWTYLLHLSPSSTIPRIVSTGLIFPLTYMCFHWHTCEHHVHLFTLSLPPPPLPTGTNPPGRTYSALLLSYFVKEKKWHFCLFKVGIQGVSLWHFHVYMYYNQNWLILSIVLLSTLVPFLWWCQQV
jgi:hypothetical protein